jgi:hypothetical protein
MMKPLMNISPRIKTWLVDRLLPLSVLGILVLFTIGWLDYVPYIGFYHTSTGEILAVYGPPRPDGLQPGDKIDSVGEIAWQDYEDDLLQPLFKGVEPGDTVEITVDRHGQILTIPWMIPLTNAQDLGGRLFNIWLFAYVFWFAGTATVLLVRPRDVRWKLMVASTYLTAVWLISGNMSVSHMLASPVVMRVAIWMCVPIYLHLHWNLPKSLLHLPRWVWYGR